MSHDVFHDLSPGGLSI